MKTTGKFYLGSSSFVLSAVLIAGIGMARADSASDNSADFGVRGKRITSNCVIQGGVLVLPQVPPPPTVDPTKDPCLGKVVGLDVSPNARWSVDQLVRRQNAEIVSCRPHNSGVDVFDTVKETAVGLAGGFVALSRPVQQSQTTLDPMGILVVNNGNIHQLWSGDGVQCSGTTTVTCTGTSNVLVHQLDKNGIPTN